MCHGSGVVCRPVQNYPIESCGLFLRMTLHARVCQQQQTRGTLTSGVATMARKPPTEQSLGRIDRMVKNFCQKTGTTTHPEPEVTKNVVNGLASHMDDLKRPLCPCRFYPDKTEEIKHRTWICPCDDMNVYKYCHCLLFTT